MEVHKGQTLASEVSYLKSWASNFLLKYLKFWNFKTQLFEILKNTQLFEELS